MKRLLFCILFFFFPGHTFAQVPSTCIASPRLLSSYSDDVKYLALTRLYKIASADTAEIEGLAAIRNVDSLVQGDSIFRSYCIHQYRKYYSLMVQVDTAYAWTHQWASLNTITGIRSLDSLTRRHHFSVTHFYSWGSPGNFAILTTDHILNLKVFSDSLLLFPGIIQVQLDNLIGDGSRLTYTTDSERTYIFSLAWGDCPAGCTNFKDWTYKVDNNCNVTLLPVVQSVTNGWAVPVNCDRPQTGIAAPGPAFEINVYPNPAKDLLNLSIKGGQGVYRYSVIDLYGRMLSSGETKNCSVISMKNFPAGILLLKIYDGNGAVYSQKLVKE
jgi:hypothetical protein